VALTGSVAILLLAGATSCTASSAAPHRSSDGATASRTAPAGAAHDPASASPPHRAASPDPVRAARSVPDGGRVRRVEIPSSTTFRPRPAYLYLPPALATHPGHAFPVLELLHGTPGQPSDWFTGGRLLATANAFAVAHHGFAPIVVVPDLNGAKRADSECIRTANGSDVETYLTRDVVRWVRHRYAREVGSRPWSVAGLSEGGLCSIMLTLRHPATYSVFGDFSGLMSPQVEHETAAQSDQTLFASAADKARHDPLWLLTHRHYGRLYAWFGVGASDPRPLRAQHALSAAARAAHLTVHTETQPGKHVWRIWAHELQAFLPWSWRYLGPNGAR